MLGRCAYLYVSTLTSGKLILLLAQHSYVDQSPLVARRLGFASLPLAVLAILVGSQSIGLMFSISSDFVSPWTWTIRSLSNAELMHYMTWAVMGFIIWIW